MKIDGTGRIIQFAEKPKVPDLKAMVRACTHNPHFHNCFVFKHNCFQITNAIALCLLAPVISSNQWCCLFRICNTASWYLHIRPISARCCNIPIHCINGCLCVQKKCLVKASDWELSILQWLWLRDYSISCEGTQCPGKLTFPENCYL